LANVFAGDKDVLIAKVDATEEAELANKFGVSGYPTLKFFPAGSAVPVDYNEARELEDLVKFINTNAGTFRNADGSLTSSAGRVAELDSIIQEASGSFNNDFLSKITAAVSLLEGKEAVFGKLYISASSKIVSKGVGYVETEIKRLQGMISSPSVVAETKTNFQLRQNVLRAFSA
jgi:protein disulfide-isomerase A6